MSGSKRTLGDTDLSPDETRRYSRHLLLQEVGPSGQRKLKTASVLVVGTGGLGSPASMYLAAAGVGRIGLIDPDIIDISNLQRQIVHGTTKLGKRKLESARERLLDLNPEVQVEIYSEAFDRLNARKITQEYDVIVDASDNFASRYLICSFFSLAS